MIQIILIDHEKFITSHNLSPRSVSRQKMQNKKEGQVMAEMFQKDEKGEQKMYTFTKTSEINF